ncbi:uncharacterized protein OCT59_019420 [Rhizophagus irregularis]|uniref:uncharacterized protein n=1 Tax=Rhizophagus irregularis TaxID=588596 RepID=UPI003332C0FC|nr:hypothetical protein OCT59_019420 [Rhizophagus irregularis]
MEKPSFVSSAVRVGFRSIEKPSFVRPFGWASEVWKNQVSIGWASEERKPKDSIGWASEKRKPKDKDLCSGLPTNENPKIKIRSGGFRLSKERKKLKIRSVSSEEWKKPRFIIQWAFEEQRKTKICKFRDL